MDSKNIYITIIGMAIVTFIPRVLPMLFFSKYEMNKELKRFISYFPVAILSSLLVKELFFVDGQLFLSMDNLNIIPAIITLIVSIKWKSIGTSVAVGVISFIVVKLLFGII